MRKRIKDTDDSYYYLDTDTGECIGEKVVYCPNDYICKPISPRQLQQMQKQQEQEYFKTYQQTQRAKETATMGHFTWCKVEQDTTLSAATLARLIYLSSYLSYNDVLMLTQRTSLQRADLASILNLSTGGVSEFLKAVDKYIIVADGQLILTDAFKKTFQKGGLKNKHNGYSKIYQESIQRLYNNVNSRGHKYLGYIFKLLPNVNIHYNILCSNIMEDNSDKLDIVTFDRFCDMYNYSSEKRNRIRKIYDSIKFETNGKKEKFCGVIDYISKGQKESMLLINPSLLNFGLSADKVNELKALNRLWL